MSDEKVTSGIEEIGHSSNRELKFVYPDHVAHSIIAQYVQVTNDDKYVLSYIENDDDVKEPCFTELLYYNGEWSKYPFHKNYNEYVFKEFDQELSDSIIENLPEFMFFKMIVDGSSKGDIYVPKKDDEQLEDTGAIVVKSKNNNYFMILLANQGDSIVNKNLESGEKYDFNFSYPLYSLKGVSSHRLRKLSNNVDVNYDLDYNELEYIHEGIPESVRKAISDYLEKDSALFFDIRTLPILEITKGNETFNVGFISCSNKDILDEVNKSEKIYVDYDMKILSLYDNNLERAIHGEVPMTCVHSDGTVKTNNVKHVGSRKVILEN